MPALAGLLALCLLLIIGYTYSASNKAFKDKMEQDKQHQAILDQLAAAQKKIEAMEKRLGNVEMIVTDAQFVDPPTSGREAIDLKAEITALKSLIQNLK
ncbi:hypothetical protein [Aureispira anguillae]|uniref:Uncharacterized protein n=1 Tax=Aureispira anguillae TaxID=2864201 RepID=A0A915YL29_9BACT|nr:hypothetical protein [Aureispira anguillae]BDS15200.1 hypothetical protein AsAng_0059840 [Aureispira anguillae]